jgi:hypothetical protein
MKHAFRIFSIFLLLIALYRANPEKNNFISLQISPNTLFLPQRNDDHFSVLCGVGNDEWTPGV